MENIKLFYKKYSIIVNIILFFILFLIVVSIFFQQILTIATFPKIGYEKLNIPFGEKLTLSNKKGKNINGIFIDGKKDKTIFFFHGNGGNLNHFERHLEYFNNLGYNVLSYSYPGYGESEGFPYKEELFEASELFLKYLNNEKKIENENITIIGFSIGTAIATNLASKYDNFHSLILMAPFTSRGDMGKRLIGIDIFKILFQNDDLITKDIIKKIKFPTMIIHGNKDFLIPISMGKSLIENSGANKKFFVQVNNSGHDDLIHIYGEHLKEYYTNFIDENYYLLDSYNEIK